MNKQTFSQGMVVLRASYPYAKIEFDAVLLNHWWEALRDLDDKSFTDSITKILKTSEYFPTPAKIIACARKESSVVMETAKPLILSHKQRQANQINIKKLIAGLSKSTSQGQMSSYRDI